MSSHVLRLEGAWLHLIGFHSPSQVHKVVIPNLWRESYASV